jgi:transposase-like protein
MSKLEAAKQPEEGTKVGQQHDKRPRRRYSDEDRAIALAALAANGDNLRRTARQLGVPRTSLLAWRNGDRHPEAAESVTPKKEALAEALEDVARKLLDGISEVMIARADLLDVMKVAAIAIDKMLVLQGATCPVCNRRSGAKG